MNKELKYLFSFVTPYWLSILGLLILIITSTVLALSSPYFLKIILDDVIPDKDYGLLIKIVFALIGIYILKLGINIGSDYLTSILQNKIIGALKNKLFQNLLYQPLNFFESNKPETLFKESIMR